MICRICLFLIMMVSCLPVTMYGQQQKVHISGVVFDPVNKGSIPNLMVVNKRTQQGSFGFNTGTFELDALKEDTLIIAATGFTTTMISFTDSAYSRSYQVQIPLSRLEIQLKPVDVFSKRDLEEIQKDIETLGYNNEDYLITGTEALSSPITALYVAFSKRERSKRKVTEMRNNDKRRALLKELFRKYIDNEIISLDNDEFDDFIDFCRVSDEFLQRSTQYDFIMYVKKRYEVYRMIKEKW